MDDCNRSQSNVAIKTENNIDYSQISAHKNDVDRQENTNAEKIVDPSLSLLVEIFSETPKIDSIVHYESTTHEYVKNDNFFRCEICIIWFNDIDELFLHIMEEHQHIELSDDIQDILYKQWGKILNMERTIIDLVSKTRFKSAKRHLKSSLMTLNGIITNVFSMNDNIFKYFIFSMRPRIKALIKEAKLLNSNNLKEIDDEIVSKTETDKILFLNKSEKIKGKKRKKKSFEEYKKNENLSDFSSDDNLCLKEAVKRIKIDVSEKFEPTVDIKKCEDCLEKVTYYVVPEKNNGDMLSYSEKEKIRIAIRDTLKKKYLDTDLFKEICFKRFDLEDDEVIPHDAFIINEWILPNKYSKLWEKMTFQEFLSKNSTKKYKKRKSDCENKYEIQKFSESEKKLHLKKNNEDEGLQIFSESKDLLINVNCNGKVTCNICFTTFSSDNELKIHKINIHHISDFRCDTCGEIFLHKGKLLQHELLHHPTNTDLISTSFVSSNDGRKNAVEVNKITGKVVKYDKNSKNAPECDRCFRRFTSFGRLSQHVAIAHGGKIFVRKKNKIKIDHSEIELDP
ncbi:uncharacterized protein LOC143909715 [Arctopsyche grandis]|uniref:uncharacterized protein LOC143909715 n=1 Tax=Arctopsyche grandis TaxID=121162 RepID=UPI00406D7888